MNIKKDVRENVNNSDMWNWTFLNELTLEEVRQFKDYIHWDQQYNYLRDMYDRWNFKDQAFFNEFRKYIEICIDAWGPFGQITGIDRKF